MKKPSSPQNAYEQLYGRPLSADELAEMKFNLINYVKLLIQLDRQHDEWLKEQADKTAKNSPRPP